MQTRIDDSSRKYLMQAMHSMHSIYHVRVISRCLAIALALVLTAAARAQDYPRRSIKVLVPYAPGGATDTVSRIVAPAMSEILKQPVVIENRTGASGNIAVELAARSAPDGYTLLMGTVSTNTINPVLFAHTLKVDPLRDLTGISLVAAIPNVLVAATQFPPHSLQEVIAYAKARPGQLNYGNTVGSFAHLDMLMLLRIAGINMVHIPSRGGSGDAVAMLVRNEIQLSWMSPTLAENHVNGGRLKAYAVTSSQRVHYLPNVPTMAEAGFGGIGSDSWHGLFAPSGTPRDIVTRLYAVLAQAAAQADVRQRFDKAVIPLTPSKSPEDFDGFVKTEAARWKKIVTDNRVTIE